MAGKGAVLAIRIVSDASKAGRGFEEATSRVDRLEAGLGRASIAAAGTLIAVGALADRAFDAASALEQSSGAVEAVFGAQSAAIKKAAEGAAQAVGLSTSAYQELATVLGSQLKNMGTPLDQVAAKTQDLTRLGADLAATFGGTTADAVGAISSLLRGERDPIERYGVTMSQAAVDAQVMALGLDTSTDASKRAAQAQATLSLLTAQTASASGQFAREADTAAGAQQRANAEFDNASASLGDALLPVVSDLSGALAGLAGFLSRNKDVVVPLVIAVGALATAVILLNGAMKAYAVIQAIVDLALSTSPLVWLAVLIVGIVAAVIIMYNKFQWFRDLVAKVGDAINWAFDRAADVLEWIISKLSWVADAASWVGDLFSAPQALSLVPTVAGGTNMGMFGAAAGVAAAPAALWGAPSSARPGGGGSTTAGAGPAQTVIHITVNGAVDPQGTADTIGGLLDKRARQTGQRPALSFGMGR